MDWLAMAARSTKSGIANQRWYDVLNVLRIETALNSRREFRVLRVIDTPHGRQRRWRPMGKGVANFWR